MYVLGLLSLTEHDGPQTAALNHLGRHGEEWKVEERSQARHDEQELGLVLLRDGRCPAAVLGDGSRELSIRPTSSFGTYRGEF